MDALKFLEEFDRMCDYYKDKICRGCPREGSPDCGVDKMNEEERAKLISDVEKWSKEHPQRTRLQDFQEKYPNVSMEPDGTPAICCIDLGYRKDNCDPTKENCVDCWNMPVEGDE